MSVADSITSFKQLVGDPLTPGSVPSPEMGRNGKEKEEEDNDDKTYDDYDYDENDYDKNNYDDSDYDDNDCDDTGNIDADD